MCYSKNNELHENENSRANKDKTIEHNATTKTILLRRPTLPTWLRAPGDRHYFRRKKQAFERMRTGPK
jgi:hypothetical protein